MAMVTMMIQTFIRRPRITGTGETTSGGEKTTEGEKTRGEERQVEKGD